MHLVTRVPFNTRAFARVPVSASDKWCRFGTKLPAEDHTSPWNRNRPTDGSTATAMPRAGRPLDNPFHNLIALVFPSAIVASVLLVSRSEVLPYTSEQLHAKTASGYFTSIRRALSVAGRGDGQELPKFLINQNPSSRMRWRV